MTLNCYYIIVVIVAVVATDLDNGESHEFRSGPIVEAVTASCSIPIIFSPVVINGVHYVDGGLFHNFPVSIIREECERIIGVNVSPLIPQKYKQTIFQTPPLLLRHHTSLDPPAYLPGTYNDKSAQRYGIWSAYIFAGSTGLRSPQ